MRKIQLTKDGDYSIHYDREKEWDFRIFRKGEDVTKELKNNLVIEMFYCLLERTSESNECLFINPENTRYITTPNGDYQFIDGELVKLPAPSNNGNP